DRPPRPAPRWPLSSSAAGILLPLCAAGYFISHPPNPTAVDNRVTVHLTGIQVNIHDTTLAFFLNGQRISPEQLQGPLDLRPGEHELVVKRGEEELEKQTFTVRRGDNQKKIEIPGGQADLV